MVLAGARRQEQTEIEGQETPCEPFHLSHPSFRRQVGISVICRLSMAISPPPVMPLTKVRQMSASPVLRLISPVAVPVSPSTPDSAM